MTTDERREERVALQDLTKGMETGESSQRTEEQRAP